MGQMGALEVRVRANEFEVLAFGEHTAAGAFENLLERDATIYCCTARE